MTELLKVNPLLLKSYLNENCSAPRNREEYAGTKQWMRTTVLDVGPKVFSWASETLRADVNYITRLIKELCERDGSLGVWGPYDMCNFRGDTVGVVLGRQTVADIVATLDSKLWRDKAAVLQFVSQDRTGTVLGQVGWHLRHDPEVCTAASRSSPG
ncbi:unnamed protein product, partial [Amoebophrya sp. A25]|eukprot:GSA25T00006227001.1